MARKASQRRGGSFRGIATVGLVLMLAVTAIAAPPRIVLVTPAPKDWVVNGAALQQVNVQFDSPVIVVDDAVSVRTLAIGTVVPVDPTPLGVPTTSIDVSFSPIRADRVTLVLSDRIVNEQGEALDGEIASPHAPLFPSGNGAVGGSAVLQFSVLSGDANRDGIVDALDFAKIRAAATNYDPLADLNSDGKIDIADESLVLNGAGISIPKTDHQRPTVVNVSPGIVPLPSGEIVVNFSELIDAETVNENSVYAVGANGAILHASGPPQSQDNVRFVFPFAEVTCEQNYEVWISNAIADPSGELLSPPASHRLFGEDNDPPSLACPLVHYVNSTTPFAITASEIAGIASIQTFLRTATADDTCSTRLGSVALASSLDHPTTDLPLGVNTVTFTATDEAGNSQTCNSFLIVVPAVPLPAIQGPQGPAGPAGSQGSSGSAGQTGAQGDPGSNGSDGQDGEDGGDGADGENGQPCWDLNGNGLADPAEDRNDDSVVNVLDCQGEQGPQGPSGQNGATGSDGSNGTDGTNGTDPPAGEPNPDSGNTDTTTRLCGSLGMINLLFLLAGLTSMRIRRR